MATTREFARLPGRTSAAEPASDRASSADQAQARCSPVGPLPPSVYQQRILDFVRFGTGNGVVVATAGAGKTTTLVQVASSLPAGISSCFLAFGRDAATELKRKLPPTTTAMTVHRLGRTVLRSALARRNVALLPVDRGKYRRLARSEITLATASARTAPPLSSETEEYLSNLCHLSRLNLTPGEDPAAVAHLALSHGLPPPGNEASETWAHARLSRVLRKGVYEALVLGLTDFTDMLYLPVKLGLVQPRFDFVCVDEAQDYSALAIAFTLRLVDAASGGRLLFVGDPMQSIYGFAGADIAGVATVIAASHARMLPLSTSYRCPRKHVALARLVSPDIEAAPGAHAGRVFWISDAVLEEWVRAGDLILCRSNSPLIGACFRLARAGRRSYLLGRDLEPRLTALAERALLSPGKTPDDRLAYFATAEESRLRRVLKGKPGEFTAVAELRDSVACLRTLLDQLVGGEASKGETLIERIGQVFGRSDGAVILSTVHRAKGKEADRVFILYPELMPAPYARSQEALHGEACVQFVALTRAREDLIFVSSTGNTLQAGRRVAEEGDAFSRYESSESTALLSPRASSDSLEPKVTEGERSPRALARSPEETFALAHDTWREVLRQARTLSRERR